jgi:hypothetical protein
MRVEQFDYQMAIFRLQAGEFLVSILDNQVFSQDPEVPEL